MHSMKPSREVRKRSFILDSNYKKDEYNPFELLQHLTDLLAKKKTEDFSAHFPNPYLLNDAHRWYLQTESSNDDYLKLVCSLIGKNPGAEQAVLYHTVTEKFEYRSQIIEKTI